MERTARLQAQDSFQMCLVFAPTGECSPMGRKLRADNDQGSAPSRPLLPKSRLLTKAEVERAGQLLRQLEARSSSHLSLADAIARDGPLHGYAETE
jgi:hypothetical protein